MYHDDFEEDRQTTTRQSFQNDEGIAPMIVWMIGMFLVVEGFMVIFK